jgi:hypothetical protein
MLGQEVWTFENNIMHVARSEKTNSMQNGHAYKITTLPTNKHTNTNITLFFCEVQI